MPKHKRNNKKTSSQPQQHAGKKEPAVDDNAQQQQAKKWGYIQGEVPKLGDVVVFCDTKVTDKHEQGLRESTQNNKLTIPRPALTHMAVITGFDGQGNPLITHQIEIQSSKQNANKSAQDTHGANHKLKKFDGINTSTLKPSSYEFFRLSGIKETKECSAQTIIDAAVGNLRLWSTTRLIYSKKHEQQHQNNTAQTLIAQHERHSHQNINNKDNDNEPTTDTINPFAFFRPAARHVVSGLPWKPESGADCMNLAIAAFGTAELMLSGALKSRTELERTYPQSPPVYVSDRHCNKKLLDETLENTKNTHPMHHGAYQALQATYEATGIHRRSETGWLPTLACINPKATLPACFPFDLDRLDTLEAFDFLRNPNGPWKKVGQCCQPKQKRQPQPRTKEQQEAENQRIDKAKAFQRAIGRPLP
jgi:hypothetical protein